MFFVVATLLDVILKLWIIKVIAERYFDKRQAFSETYCNNP